MYNRAAALGAEFVARVSTSTLAPSLVVPSAVVLSRAVTGKASVPTLTSTVRLPTTL